MYKVLIEVKKGRRKRFLRRRNTEQRDLAGKHQTEERQCRQDEK